MSLAINLFLHRDLRLRSCSVFASSNFKSAKGLCWQVKQTHRTFRLVQAENRASASRISCSAKQVSCVHPRHWLQYRFCRVVGRIYPPFPLCGSGFSLQRLAATQRTLLVGLRALMANGAAGSLVDGVIHWHGPSRASSRCQRLDHMTQSWDSDHARGAPGIQGSRARCTGIVP